MGKLDNRELVTSGTDVSSPGSPHKKMWVAWLLFFFYFAGVGIYFTFLNVYYREAGLSGTQIGTLTMTTAMFNVASAVMWGYLSDRTGKNRLLIAAGSVGALVVAQFIPAAKTFPALIALSALSGSMSSAPMTLIDSTALAMLGDRRSEYGRYRLGGSLGYVATAFLAGFLFDQIGLRMIFPAYAVVMVVFAGIALLLPDIPVQRDQQARGDMKEMIRQPVWLVFAISILLVSIGMNASLSFLGVTIKGMGASQGLIGIVSSVPALIEVPFMLYSGLFLRRFGTVRLLLFSIALMALRLFLLGVMPAPEWAAGINAINGPAYVLFWTSAVTYNYALAPQSLKATAQGMLNSAISMANVASALLTGWLFDLLGPGQMFIVMGFVTVLALIIFGAGNLIKRPEQAVEKQQAV